MCGIVGLLVKEPRMRERLGEWMLPMLVGMTERGPDSAGMAVFTEPVTEGAIKLSLYSGEAHPASRVDWPALGAAFRAALDASATLRVAHNHAVLGTTARPEAARAWLSDHAPRLKVLSAGRSIDLYKDVGLPADIAARYRLGEVAGSHLVGHTRMATESAVNVDNAHPYTAGLDWCLVHNGSLSNPYQLRRALEPLGIAFDGDCDTEAACRYLEWRMREGDALEAAIARGFDVFDGFYTFLMGTRDKLALVRDPFACKPAIVAETDDYVAIASEFRSLAHLPGIRHASLFEPKPAHVYSWSVRR
ncbi:MAG: class II glutamine amidotransferase [Lautropia sp.]